MSKKINEEHISDTKRVEIYLQAQTEAKRNRNSFKTNVDPILQRDSKYAKKITPSSKKETEKYYTDMAPKDERPRKTKIPQMDTLQFTDSISSLPPQKENLHKKCLTEQYEQNNHKEKTSSLKYVNSNAKKDLINDIFTGAQEQNKERAHIKLVANSGKPSESYIKMNEKRSNLPHNKPFNTRTNNEDTFKKIFVEQGAVERPHKKNINQQKSSVAALMAYDNTPKGYDYVAAKPNQSNYADIVKTIEANKNNPVMYKKKAI